MKVRLLMILFKKKKLPDKPNKPEFCITCSAYLDMEKYFEYFRYTIKDGCNAGSYTNCIVGCGYGMFAPRFYKENVIDVRRGRLPAIPKNFLKRK